jgi:hypothetical protein
MIKYNGLPLKSNTVEAMTYFECGQISPHCGPLSPCGRMTPHCGRMTPHYGQ